MSPAGVDFEERYRSDPDPWGYESSGYEHAKYAATLSACGPGPFDSALELGASIGVFSAQLAPRAKSLVTIDGAPTAVAAARRRLAPFPQARVLLGTIPDELPDGRFDLVVASEVLYYLTVSAVERALARLREAMAPGGRLVAVHWRPTGPERPLDARTVHDLLRAQAWLAPVNRADTGDYLLDVLEAR
ncbi:MAG TPA: SAM-dependent methyltransferase [Solirubrobacteraceae bacterium]|nr:SAM-dependent methyltransferase [Solirubrobacteraceae bacterium]